VLLYLNIQLLISKVVRAEYSGLNWLSKSLSLSSGLLLVVDIVDVFLSCNCRVQMEI